ncbi:hypothetical protein [Bacillus cereus]|nr:hypothetical protein [Bacillus cereus]
MIAVIVFENIGDSDRVILQIDFYKSSDHMSIFILEDDVIQA